MSDNGKESWKDREELIGELKSDPVLRPYFEDGTFAVTNGPEKSPCGFAIAIDCTPYTYVILPLFFRS